MSINLLPTPEERANLQAAADLQTAVDYNAAVAALRELQAAATAQEKRQLVAFQEMQAVAQHKESEKRALLREMRKIANVQSWTAALAIARAAIAAAEGSAS